MDNPVVVSRFPKIFALTADVDEDKIKVYKKAGFRKIFTDLTKDTMTQMLRDSNLQIRKEPSVSSSHNSSFKHLMLESVELNSEEDQWSYLFLLSISFIYFYKLNL